MKTQYLYEAKIINVVDGDTVDALVDLGFHVYMNMRLRLYGIDTAEKNDKDPVLREKAKAATEFLSSIVLGKSVLIETFKKDKYGRFLAKIFLPEQTTVSVNDAILNENLAIEYFGGKK